VLAPVHVFKGKLCVVLAPVHVFKGKLCVVLAPVHVLYQLCLDQSKITLKAGRAQD